MRWFKRRPKDRWPEWRPDQVLTPENRTMIRPHPDPLLPRENYEALKVVDCTGKTHLLGYVRKDVFAAGYRIKISDVVEPHRVSSQ